MTYIIRCIFILTLTLSALSARALPLKTESFTSRPTDISALRADVRDLNGNVCALVRVEIPVEGCKFEGNIIKAEYDVNEYLVYLSGGTKMFRIKCPNSPSAEVRFSEISSIESVEPGAVYVLEVSGYALPSSNVPAADPGGNYLILDILPPTGALVKVDGLSQSVENGKTMTFLKYGIHTYEIQADGFAPVTGTAEIGHDGNTIEKITLTSVRATLSISTETAGASIAINNRHVGTDSYTAALNPGSYLIEVTKEGHNTATLSVELGASEQQNITVPALTPRYGAVNVGYSPVGAQIEIDGRPAGNTPAILQNIGVGRHTITVSSEGYTPYTATFDVAEGKTTTLQGKLEQGGNHHPEISLFAWPAYNHNPSGSLGGHEYVDLGLPSGILWATCNIGADSHDKNGKYFAWGETEPKEEYSVTTSKTYNVGKIKSISGNPDYDAAAAHWGNGWRMPSNAEIDELLEHCTLRLTYSGDKKGFLVTGPNGNAIFLPAASHKTGLRKYGEDTEIWSGDVYVPTTYNDFWASQLDLDDSYDGKKKGISRFNYRYIGLPVRPVVSGADK